MARSGEHTGWWRGLTTSALGFGAVHALVDCASGYLIYAELSVTPLSTRTVVALVVLYNALAFGLQAPIGLVLDRWPRYRVAAIAGALVAAIALPLGRVAVTSGIVAVGIGNALFHVGAGAQVLESSGDRATESGIFVGPGAVGLALGLWLGAHAVPCGWILSGLLVLSTPLLWWKSRLCFSV
jgi:FSR family fosmidomycin resistance protein-like MFS transporter